MVRLVAVVAEVVVGKGGVGEIMGEELVGGWIVSAGDRGEVEFEECVPDESKVVDRVVVFFGGDGCSGLDSNLIFVRAWGMLWGGRGYRCRGINRRWEPGTVDRLVEHL